jgi:hypothetical protein
MLPEHRKKRIERSRLNDVLSRRIDLAVHNLRSERLKNDIGEVDEAKFQGFERPCALIFFILVIERNDLDQFA